MIVNKNTLPSKLVARRDLNLGLLLVLAGMFCIHSVLVLSNNTSRTNNKSFPQKEEEKVHQGYHHRILRVTTPLVPVRTTTTSTTTLRQEWERHYSPLDRNRMMAVVTKNRDPLGEPHQHAHVPYDIFNCPWEPPVGYPFAWNLEDVLMHWNTEQVQLPPNHDFHHSLCIMDWETQQDLAQHYRERELPFIVRNHPAILQTSERWLSPEYLETLLGNATHLTEASPTSFFPFVRPGIAIKNNNNQKIDPSTLTQRQMHSYSDFKARALAMDHMVANHRDGGTSKSYQDLVNQEHLYFRLNGSRGQKKQQQTQPGRNEFLYDELSFFDDSSNTPASNFFMVDKGLDRGIHCRFGMAGVTFPMHFDYDRNFIAVFGGKRRLILVRTYILQRSWLHVLGVRMRMAVS